MGGGSTTTDYSSLPVYGDQADLDYAVRTGQIGAGDRARMGNSIYEYDREGGWQRIRTLPPGTFADPVTGTTPGILNPLPDLVTGGILNPSPTGGITDPNYKSLGEYLVGPTYTGPTTADEYVMQRAGGPAWDYTYPMYLGAGVYGPGGSLPTVTSTGDWTTTTPTTDTTTDTTTTTTTTTDDDDDTDSTLPWNTEEGAEGIDVRDGPRTYGWGDDQIAPVFDTTWPGIVRYNQRVEDMGPTAAFGLLEGLRRTDPAFEMHPGATEAMYGGAGDPGWAPESTIQQRVDSTGMVRPSTFTEMLANSLLGAGRSKPSEKIAAKVDALTPQQQQQEVIQTAPVSTAQMKQDQMAAQAQQAARQRQLDAAAQAAAQAQAASQAQAAQAIADAQAYIDFAAGRDKGVDERQLAAAREVMSQVDTFAGGGLLGEGGYGQTEAEIAAAVADEGGFY
jgi:hypothetical protein